MTLQPEVDKDMCISSGKCVADYPGGFTFDEEEIAEALPTVGQLSDDDVVAAARICPSGAIIVRDQQGNELDII